MAFKVVAEIGGQGHEAIRLWKVLGVLLWNHRRSGVHTGERGVGDSISVVKERARVRPRPLFLGYGFAVYRYLAADGN